MVRGRGEHFLSHKASGPEAKRHHISFQKSLLPASPFSSLRAHCVVHFFTFSYTPVPVSVLVGDPCVHGQGVGTGVPLSTWLCVRALIPSASTVRPVPGMHPALGLHAGWPSRVTWPMVRPAGNLRRKTYPDALSVSAGSLSLPQRNYLRATKYYKCYSQRFLVPRCLLACLVLSTLLACKGRLLAVGGEQLHAQGPCTPGSWLTASQDTKSGPH